jgi:S-adenosylmethionine decarboxylase
VLEAHPHVAAGGRWVVELYGCNGRALEDLDLIREALRRALLDLGADPNGIQYLAHKFEPQGLSATAMSSVAMVTMHTWPEDHRSATIDLYFYCADADARRTIKQLIAALGASQEVHHPRLRELCSTT